MDERAGPHLGSNRGAITALHALMLGPLSLVFLGLQDWYVDVGAPDCTTGTGSPSNPFCNIQDAANAAADGDMIHIAPGTYFENLLIDKDLTLIGTDGREVTIVDGMESGSVVRVRDASANFTGLTLTNGTGTAFGRPNVTNAGGGLLVYSPLALLPAVTLTNCSVTGNASDGGAGIASGVLYDLPGYPYFAEVGGGILTLTNTTVNANSGVGIFSLESMFLTNSTISSNRVSYGYNIGGGIYSRFREVTLTNSTVSGNGGAGLRDVGSVTATNCTVNANEGPGFLYVNELTLTNCTVNDNGVSYGRFAGGIVAFSGGDVTLTDSTVNGNRGTVVGGVWSLNPLVLTNCTVNGNTGGYRGGIAATNATLTDCTVSGNTSGWLGGGIFAYNATLRNCTVNENTAGSAFGASGYGGGICSFGNSLTITNSTLSNNSAIGNLSYDGLYTGGRGGGIWLYGFGEAVVSLTNVTLTGNTADYYGGGIGLQNDSYDDNSSSTLFLTNSTVSQNTALFGGDAIFAEADGPAPCTAVVANSILWGNGPNPIQLMGTRANAKIGFSLVEGGWAGTGNLDRDPIFVDPMNGDFRLMPGSPAIDAGNNLAVPIGVNTDIRGAPRIINGTVDMGAYEYFQRWRRANVPVTSVPPRVIR